jgi:uncharacterized protein (TIGR02598 family)
MKPTLAPKSVALPTRTRSGFSLVEVVLAVGIMGLGVVTILGLLPHGLELSRKTFNEQAHTRIVDSIASDLQGASWADMAGATRAGGIKFFFDDQGLRQESSTNATFVARAQMVNEAELTIGMPMPGNANSLQPNPNLRRIRIDVATSQDQNFNFDAPPAAAPVKRYTALVAKMRP